MSKLLFIYEREMPTVSITRDVYTHLKHFPEIRADFVKLTEATEKDIDSHDVIIFLRPMYVYGWRIAKRARNAGHCVITFCDDDQLHLPPSLPTIPWRKKGMLRVLQHSDVIESTSERILRTYVPLTAGKRTARQDTIVREEELPKPGEAGGEQETTKIVYAAAGSHAALFEEFITPILKELHSRYGNRISLTFVGAHPKTNGAPCEYVSAMPLAEYRQYMRGQRFDIGVAPLRTDDFSKCKYFNKYLEYTTQGIPGIYTKTEPYTDAVTDGVNGMLCENTPESWREALCRAIDHPEERRQMLVGAVEHLRKNHTEEAIIGQFIRDVPEIGGEGKTYEKIRPFRFLKPLYFLSLPADWLVLAMFHIRQNGLKDVIRRVVFHLRHKIV